MGRWTRRAPDVIALGGAVLLHAAVLVGLRDAAPPPTLRAAIASSIRYSVEIDIVRLDEPRDGVALMRGVALPGGSRLTSVRRGSGATRTPDAPAGESIQPAPDGEGAPVAPGDEWSGPPPAEPILPGLGGAPVWAIPGAVAMPERVPAPTAPPSARPPPRDVATQVLRGTMGVEERDKGMEVPLGGILARSFADSARRVSLPHDCRATFEVRVGADGHVAYIRHVSATASDAATWQRVASGVSGAFNGRKLPVTGRASRGAVVTITVVSRYVYPSGSADPSVSDLGSNKSDVIHATYAVAVPGEKALPPGGVKRVDTQSPYVKGTPKGVVPVEIKSHDPGR